MTKILFVCHGNICRSPMAEYIMKDKLYHISRTDIIVRSAATSSEEIGNDIYWPAKQKLTEKSVPFGKHSARRITKSDYEDYDLLIGMDSKNVSNMVKFFGGDAEGKIRKLLDRDVYDPWYSGDFETAFTDIEEGIDKLLQELL